MSEYLDVIVYVIISLSIFDIKKMDKTYKNIYIFLLIIYFSAHIIYIPKNLHEIISYLMVIYVILFKMGKLDYSPRVKLNE